MKLNLKKNLSRLVMFTLIAGLLLSPLAGCRKLDGQPVKVELTVAKVTAIAALVAEKTAEAHDILWQDGKGYVSPQQRETAFKALRIVERDGRALVDKLTQGVQLNPQDLLALSDFLDDAAMTFAGLAALNLAPDVKAKVQTIADWVLRGTSAARIIIVALLPANGTRGGRAVDLENVTITIEPLNVTEPKTRGNINDAITQLTALSVSVAKEISMILVLDTEAVKARRLQSLNNLATRLTAAGY